MRFLYSALILLSVCATGVLAQVGPISIEKERHFKNVKQLTFGGENAEAYFSSNGKQLIFQSKRDGHGCDRIYSMNIDGSATKQLSNGEGRTTCAYYFKGGKRIIYASPHSGGRDCQPEPDRSNGYVWP